MMEGFFGGRTIVLLISDCEERRQALQRTLSLWGPCVALSPSQSSRAVSYTHLDVYKRQPEDKVIELHGNGTYATCLTSGWRHELAAIRPVFEATGEPPACTICAGPVKSATISFGQAMPQEAMKRAQMLALDLSLIHI